MKNKLHISEYQEVWPEQFQEEKKYLLETLGHSTVIQIHHIGSTSIKGLCAKPVIDMIMEVISLEKLDTLCAEMTQMGYKAKGEFGLEGRRYFQKGKPLRTHQIHAYQVGDTNIMRHLAFRDYMIAFPQKREAYAALKRRAVELFGDDKTKYISYKNDFIETHEKYALKWFQELNNKSR